MIDRHEEITLEDIADIGFYYQTAIFTALKYKKERETLFYLDEYYSVKREIRGYKDGIEYR